jgi:hypothetical protein
VPVTGPYRARTNHLKAGGFDYPVIKKCVLIYNIFIAYNKIKKVGRYKINDSKEQNRIICAALLQTYA